MRRQHFYVTLCYFLSLFLAETALENLFGIDPSCLGDYYISLLFDDHLSIADQTALTNRLSASILHMNIEKKLEELEEIEKRQLFSPSSSDVIKKTKEFFKEILEKNFVSGNEFVDQNFSLNNICLLWQLKNFVNNLQDMLETAKQKKQKNVKPVQNFKMKRNNCAELDVIMAASEQNHLYRTPSWVDEFREHLSGMHSSLMHMMIKEGNDKLCNLHNPQMLADETKLAYMLRRLNVEGKMDLLMGAKQRMVRNLVNIDDLYLLELLNPIRLAAGFSYESTLKKYFQMIFCNLENQIEQFLEYAIICNQIFALFVEVNENERENLESLWMRFNELIENVEIGLQNEKMVVKVEGNLMEEIYGILHDLKRERGEGRGKSDELISRRTKSLLHYLTQTFVDLHSENVRFRKCFEQQALLRPRFMQMIKNIETNLANGERVVPDQFWHIFNVCDQLKEGQDQLQSAELFFLTMTITDVCPDKDASSGKLEETEDKLHLLESVMSSESMLLMSIYLPLLWKPTQERGEVEKNELARRAQVGAIVFYYEDRVTELFKFGQFCLENDTFVNKIGVYSDQFFVLLNGPNEQKLEEKMCIIYQFIFKLVRDKELMEMCEEWRKMVANNVKEWGKDPTEEIKLGKIILLWDRNNPNRIPWHQLNCADEHNVRELATEFRQSSALIELFHLFALMRLISQFANLRSLFCNASLQYIAWLKHQIVATISYSTLDRLETFFPRVMQYGRLTHVQLANMLLNQFNHKSGSLEAENIEARCSSSSLLHSIEKYEAKLLNNGQKAFKNMPMVRSTFLQKIAFIRNEFFARLSIRGDKGILIMMRTALCPLLHLFILMDEMMKGNYLKLNEEKFDQNWYPYECEEEEGVKRALKMNRELFRAHIYDFFENNPDYYSEFLLKLKEKRGAVIRFWKFLNSEVNNEILPEIRNSNWIVKSLWMSNQQTANELFNDDTRLYSHYIDFLTSTDSMDWLNDKLKLDLFVFVRWVDAKIANFADSFIKQRCANVWRRNKYLFYQLYDRWSDEHLNKMPSFQIYQTFFLIEINLFWEKTLQGKQMKNERAMEDEIRKIIQKAQKTYEESKEAVTNNVKAKPKTNSDHHFEKFINFDAKLMCMHVETINKFAEQDEQRRKTLKFIYESFVNLESLPDYLGKVTIQQIWKLLESNHFGASKTEEKANNENKEEEEEMTNNIEKCEMNLKKKKQKRKKNKNAITVEGTRTDTVIGKEQPNKSVVKTHISGTDNGENGMERIGTDSMTASVAAAEETTSATAEEEEDTIGKEEKTTKNGTVTQCTVGGGEDSDRQQQKLANNKHGEGHHLMKNDNDDQAAAENGDLKLRDFADDYFLASKYEEIVTAVVAAYANSQQNDGSNDEKRPMGIDLLNVGILANEIAHRLEALKWLNGDQRPKNDQQSKNIADQWERVKEMKYSTNSSYDHTLSILYQLLNALVEEMDETTHSEEDKLNKRESKSKNGKVELEKLDKIVEKLHCRKFGTAIIEGRIKNWEKLSKKQQKLTLSTIFACNDREKNEQIFEEFYRNLDLLNRAEKQRNLDKNIFSQYKNNSNLSKFVENKDKLNFEEKSAELFPAEKWQDLNGATDEGEEGNLGGVKRAAADNEQQQIGREVFIELKQIFNEWSTAAQFQFPSRYFLTDSSLNKSETICLLPDGFEQELIFGHSECDQTDKDKCADSSLNCALCKKLSTALFIQKYPNGNFSFVPSMTIGICCNAQIGIKFVQIANFGHIPRKNFTSKQMEVFLMKLAQSIDKLEEGDHFDEGVYRYEVGKRTELRRERYEDSNKKFDTDELRQFDQITDLFHQSRAKAMRQRELAKEGKETLFVLAEHAGNLKLLQLLLHESDYLSIVNKFQLDNDHKTMGKFRKILSFLKRWAKNNNIYCKKMGYLNEEMLLVMLTKVFLLFPNSSMPFLIDKFFLIYSKWKWPMPVQLEQIGTKRFGDCLRWTPYREWFARRHFVSKCVQKNKGTDQRQVGMALKNVRMELAMAVTMPTFPEQNVAETVNMSSAKMVQNELKRAWEKLRTKKEIWALAETENTLKFIEKYEHFIVIKCKGTSFNVDKFCDFVGKRLRHELLEFVENPLAIWAEFCHIFPKVITPKQCSSSIAGQKTQNGNNCSICERLWLVGIQMAPNQKANSAFKRKLKDNLRKKMDPKIKNEFEKGCFHNVHLKSEFAEDKEFLWTNWQINANLLMETDGRTSKES